MLLASDLPYLALANVGEPRNTAAPQSATPANTDSNIEYLAPHVLTELPVDIYF